MAEYLECFDLDLLPSMSPGTSDSTGGGSKEEKLEKFSFIMNAAEKDQPQSTMAPAQDEEEISNNMNFTPSDEAYAVEAVNLLDLDVVSDDTATRTSEDGRDDRPNVEVPLSQGQLELIMQTTGICTTTSEAEQNHSQSMIIKGSTNQESNCSVFIIKVPATPATSLQDTVSIVTSTTSGYQSRNPPLKANKPSRRRREKTEKLYQKPKFDDEEQEAKRQRAINAHKYRSDKKQEKMTLGLQVEEAVKERNKIKIEVEKEKEKKNKLMAKLELVKEAFDQV